MNNATTLPAARTLVSEKELGLPWTTTLPGNHNTDGVMIQRLNPAGLAVYVAAVRFQGTIPAMCAESVAAEIVHRVQVHEKLVRLVGQLREYLSVAADDGSFDEELERNAAELAALI